MTRIVLDPCPSGQVHVGAKTAARSYVGETRWHPGCGIVWTWLPARGPDRLEGYAAHRARPDRR